MDAIKSEELGLNYLKFPSVVAKIPDFRPHKGYQMGFAGETFAIGDMCLEHRLDWDRPINAKPDNKIWQVLFLQAVASHHLGEVSVVVGAPHSIAGTDFMSAVPRGKIEIRMPHDERRITTIKDVYVASECAGHALAYRKLFGKPTLVISLGFGTVELGAATEAGVIPESLHSITYGLHHCAPLLRMELKKLGYDPSHIKDNQFHFFDEILKKVQEEDPDLCLRRENSPPLTARELKPAFDRVLESYAEKLVSHIQKYALQFDRKMDVVLTGGGTLYPVLVSRLTRFLESQHYNVAKADSEMSILSAALGYSIIASELFGHEGIGIDVGNNTVITLLKKARLHG